MSPVRLLTTDRSSPRELITLLGIVAFAVIPLVAYLIWSGYQVAIDDAETTTRNYAAILEARLDATLRRADANLLEMTRTIPVAALSRQAVPRYARELNVALNHHLVNFKEIGSFRVFDGHGDELYTSDSARTSNVNVGDRGYFRQLRDNLQVGLVFSEVITGRVTKRPVLVMARALTDERGSFSGVVIAPLELQHFQTLLQSLAIGPEGLITLRRSDDHKVLVRRPHLDREINVPLNPQHPVVKALAAGDRAATLQYAAQSDGVQRIFSYKVLERYPFYVNVGVSRDEVLAEWRTRSRAIAALGLLLLGLLACLLVRLSRSMAREAQTTDALKESESNLRKMLDAMLEGCQIVGFDWRYLYLNATAQTHNRRPNAELLGKTMMECWPGITATELFALEQSCMEQRTTHRLTNEFVFPDGGKGWFSLIIQPVPQGIALYSEDITERIQAEESLRLLNLELEAKVLARTAELQQANAVLARSVTDLADFKAALDEHAIVAATDAQGTITYVNDKFCAISKYAREELIGQNHRIVNSGHHPQAFFRELWQTIGSGGTWKGEIRNRAKDGTFYWVDTTIVPFLDEQQKPVQYVTIRADISERKRAEQALVAARNAAELANSAKDSFLATMSHEIRTPLGGLMGMLELLSLSPLNCEQADTLQTARDSGRSLLRILNDILDWSKIEDGKLELAPQATSIAPLVAEVANTYAHVASANSVTLMQQVDERLSRALIVDPLRLSQVLNNFVSNAIKFSHGGQVELRAELLERHDGAERLRFSVKDTGIGIDPEVQQRLFQHYGQGSADTARMYGGTGLGLAICRRLADLLDARIDLESAPGHGSTFSITLTLPIAETVVEAEQSPAEMVAAASVQPLVQGSAAEAPLVLVVDDHPINRKLLARQLGLLGLRAETAENGEAALALWRARRYAVVITDCHMPVMDGYALTLAIRAIEVAEARPRMPIFAWTANALADEIDNCSAAGMDELLVKPADLVQLKTVLAKWLPTGIAGSAETPVVVSPASTVVPLDVSVLAALVGDDPAVIREFLPDFRTSAATTAVELAAACAAGQATQAGALAHKLKSAARSVGALKLGELCADIEQAGRSGETNALAPLLASFEREMAAVEAYLDALMEGAA